MVSAQRWAPSANLSDQVRGGTPTSARYLLCSARIRLLSIAKAAAEAEIDETEYKPAANVTAPSARSVCIEIPSTSQRGNVYRESEQPPMPGRKPHNVFRCSAAKEEPALPP